MHKSDFDFSAVSLHASTMRTVGDVFQNARWSDILSVEMAAPALVLIAVIAALRVKEISFKSFRAEFFK